MEASKKYDLILGMGEACSCTLLLRSKNLQEFSYPFDWMYGSTFEKRMEIVTSFFENFLNKEDLVYSHAEASISCDAYKNTLNDLTFNHDFPKDVPLDESFKDVKAKYDRRIARLIYKLMCSQNSLLVFIELPNTKHTLPSDEVLLKAQTDLERAFPVNRCEILYVKHDPTVASDYFDYKNVTDKILKVTINNKSTKSGAHESHVNEKALLTIIDGYQLNKK